MLYYAVICAAVVMFGVNFLFNQQYEKQCGNSVRSMLIFSLVSSAAGFVVLLIINGFHAEFTVFSFLMALLTALNTVAFTFCSLKALGKINLSLYSVFSMLGGMVLPSVFGIAFFDEAVTVGKIICAVLVVAALLLTVRGDIGKNGAGYYIGIFVLNGMNGVITKFFQAAPFEKTSDAGFSALAAALSVALSGIFLLFVRGERVKLSAKAVVSMIGSGALGRIGNYLLLIALWHVPASAQYPMVTGGVMIVSTVICFFTSQKPDKRDIAAVALAFAGIIALVLL